MHISEETFEQPRAPTLQGALSHCPYECMKKVAAKTNVPQSSLATLTVMHSTSALYKAVLEYAAMCPSPDPKMHNPLIVMDFEDDKDDSSDSDDDPDDQVSHLIRRMETNRIEGGSGLRRRRYPVPNFKYGLGETAIVWPPPPELTVEHLVALREQKRSRNSKKKQANAKIVADLVKNADDSMTDGVDGNDVSPKEVSKDTKTIYALHYSVGEPKPTESGSLLTYRELLLISSDGPEVLRNFAREIIQWKADKDYVESDGSKFALMRFKTSAHGDGWWQAEGMKRARPPSSVILPKGQIDAILKDIRNFVKPETKSWYLSHGLPHRRSYLFYGPPGTGKTSTIRAIASVFRLVCCFLSMTTANFSNQVLGDALSQIPPNALIVLEDVDALFNEDRKNEQTNNLTFSGLLNALDGLISADGVISVMTTNHIERLDKALIRGGRVDRRFHFAKPTHEQIKDLFLSFYPDAGDVLANKFLQAILERPYGDEVRSIATLQQLFIDQRENTAEECIAGIPVFFDAHFPDGTRPRAQTLYN